MSALISLHRAAAVGTLSRRQNVEERQIIENFLTSRTEEAFGALFEVMCVRLHRYFLLRGLDRATAEELTQNVLLKVYRRSRELREAERFYGWLFTIARHEMVSYWRRKQARIETVDLESLPHEALHHLTSEPDLLSPLRLKEWLQQLEPAERDLVVLCFVEGLSYEELAEAFELPLGTIKWRVFNVRKKLSHIILTPSVNQRQRKSMSADFE